MADRSVFVVASSSWSDRARRRTAELRDRGRAWTAELDGERGRWLAAAGLIVATLGAGVGFTSGSLPAVVTQAAASTPAPGGDGSPPAGPYSVTAPPLDSPVPIGKGMWLNNFDRSAGGDPQALVARARELGLSHLYVRLGSSKKGFYAQSVLERLLPVAHAAGIKVVGWDFPTLADPGADAARARAEIFYTTVGGHRIDAFSADIETPAEGTRLSAGAALLYGSTLRTAAGDGYPLIATVPRPSPKRWFPFAEVVASFDAVAPMVYWGSRDPVTDVQGAVAALAPYGKPVMPIGQAYDSAIDGWKGGSPSKEAIARFTQAAYDAGAVGVSYWVWETAEPQHWAAIGESRQFRIDAAAVAAGDVHAVGYLERVVAALGHPTVVDGRFDHGTEAALADFQRRQGVPPSGELDERTVVALVQPRA